MSGAAACRKCRRLFEYIAGEEICPECRKAMEGKFHEVKEYIYDHPGCKTDEVARECEVSELDIRSWIKEGRIEYSSSKGSDIYCKYCWAPIATGEVCDACRARLSKDLNGAYVKKKDDPSKEGPGKMRYI